VTAHQSCTDPGYPIGLTRVVPVAHVTVSSTENAARADRTCDRFTGAVQVIYIGDGDHRTQERLAGHTPPVGTFTAHQFSFDHCDAETTRSGALGGILSNRSGAENDDIVSMFGCCHFRPFRSDGLTAYCDIED
jgi:hypothetical protein